MFNGHGGFLCHPLRCSQITLPPFLLFEWGLTDKFPKPPFCFLNNPMGVIPKIEILSFRRIFCRLWSKVFGRHFTVKRVCMDGRWYSLRLFKRNLHSLGVPMRIRAGSTCLFLRQTRGGNATLPPVIVDWQISNMMQDFSNRYLRYWLKHTFIPYGLFCLT